MNGSKCRYVRITVPVFMSLSLANPCPCFVPLRVLKMGVGGWETVQSIELRVWRGAEQG